jgi:hypothetical protein
MYKVKSNYVGMLIMKGNRKYTLYNSLDQEYLGYLYKELGSEYITYIKPKKDAESKQEK